MKFFEGEQIGIMDEETREAPAQKPEKSEKSGIKIVSVIAAALAAVTAALLGSTLGVAGTVLGAGVASVVTTVGGEVYLRSLQRTREAAQRAKALAVLGARRAGTKEEPVPEIVEDEAEEAKSRWKPRWPLIIGTSLIAFVIAIVAITGFEGATGKTFGGGEGTTIGKIVGGDKAAAPVDEPKTPATSESTPTDTPTDTPTTTPSTSTTTVTAPPTTPTTPSTTPTTPTTTSSPPATTGTPTPTGASLSGAN